LYAKHLLVDAQKFWVEAGKLADGASLFGMKGAFPDYFYQPPAYSWLLSGFIRMAGETLWVPRMFQAFCGMLTCVLLIRLGRRLGGESAPWVGVAAGLLFALSPETLLMEQDLLTPALLTVCLAGALVALILPERPRSWMAGLLLGCASALHPTMLLTAAVLGGALVWSVFRATSKPSKPVWLILAYGLGVAAPLAPTAWINNQTHGGFTLVSHNGGINFYIGNGTDWRESMFVRAGVPFERFATKAEPWKYDVVERDGIWWSMAWDEIASDPMAWLAALGTKARWSVHHAGIPRNEDHRCRTQDGPMQWLRYLPARFGWVFPFAVIGACAMWRRGGRARWTSLAWLGLHAPLVVFIVASRYRVVAWPVLCLLAPMGLLTCRAWLSASDTHRGKWLGVVGLAVLPWLPREGAGLDASWCDHTRGSLLINEGRLQESIEAFDDSLEADPENLGALWWNARTLEHQGKFEDALKYAVQLVDKAPDHYRGRMLTSSLFARTHQLVAAREQACAAWEIPGKRKAAGVQCARLRQQTGQLIEAQTMLEENPQLR